LAAQVAGVDQLKRSVRAASSLSANKLDETPRF
jgi:hypothetical protein